VTPYPRLRQRLPRRALAVPALALAAVLPLVGCGGATEVDYVKASETIRASLESPREGFGTQVEAVDCPSGIEVQAGTTFVCTVRWPDGKVAYARVKIRDAKADLSLETLSPHPANR
jgi:hypothetical protein